MSKLIVSTALLVVAGCASMPPAAAPQRGPTEVNMSFAKTWEAAIDVFAQRNIAIKTLDRASGLIVAEAQAVAAADSPPIADCGTIMGMPIRANYATWNVIVRGDSTHATIRANVRFVNRTSTRGAFGQQSNDVTECSTKGVWESEFEKELRLAAEAK